MSDPSPDERRPDPAPATGRGAVEEELQRTNALLDALRRAHLAYLGGAGRRELFDALLASVLDLTGSEYGFIGEVHRKEDGAPYLLTHAITNIAWNDETRRFYDAESPQGIRFENLATLFGAVMTGGTHVISNDPAADPRRGGLPPGHPALRAFLGLPFFRGDEMIGMIGIANRPGGYDAELVRWLDPVLVSLAGLIGAYRTERIKREIEAERAEQAEQLRRLREVLDRRERELGEFVHMAHHDLREPLRTLRTYGELLRRDAGGLLPERAREDLGFLVEASERMQALVRDLLILIRVGEDPLDERRVSPGAAVDRALGALADLVAAAGARIERDDLTDVRADAGMLAQVYEHLLRNALRFAGKDRPRIRLTARVDGERVLLGVEDDGVGIDAEHAEAVFAPFRRLQGRSSASGTGVGLAICRKAVERHGGTIWVEPSRTGGAHVRFTLPRADTEASSAA